MKTETATTKPVFDPEVPPRLDFLNVLGRLHGVHGVF